MKKAMLALISLLTVVCLSCSKGTLYTGAFQQNGTPVILDENGKIFSHRDWTQFPKWFHPDLKNGNLLSPSLMYCIFHDIPLSSVKINNPYIAPIVDWGYGEIKIDFSKIEGSRWGIETISYDEKPPIKSLDDVVIGKKPYWIWNVENGWKKGEIVYR